MKILFTTPYKPYKKAKVFEDNIDFFYYRNTLKQGIFQLRQMQSWHSLHFIAQNLPVNSVVLENPKFHKFKSEVEKNNYDAIAIGFTIVTASRVLEMIKWVKKFFPKIDIIIGGYGTAIFHENFGIEQEIKNNSNYICFGEGVSFMRNYLKEKYGIDSQEPLKQDLLPIKMGFFRSKVTIQETLNFISTLGCNYDCCFCSTSSHFKKKVNLFSGEKLYKAIKQNIKKHKRANSGVIFDEDFLADKPAVMEFIKCVESDEEFKNKPFLLTVFSSAKSVAQYSLSELIRCGIGMIYIGVESFNTDILNNEKLYKRDGDEVDISSMFKELNQAGIHTLGSIIIGWDNQSKEMAYNELQQFVSLNPTMYQVMPLQAIPGTPLWAKMKNEKRIVDNYNYSNVRLEKASFKYKHFSQEESVSMIYNTYQKLVDDGGPWPFRMFTNIRNGIKTMKKLEGDEFKTRLNTYKKMKFPLYVLSFISGIMFFGKNFRKKWNKEMKDCFFENPFYFFIVVLISIVSLPLLILIVLWGKIRHFVLPFGDQPETIRMEY